MCSDGVVGVVLYGVVGLHCTQLVMMWMVLYYKLCGDGFVRTVALLAPQVALTPGK